LLKHHQKGRSMTS